ncbi:TPA: hypothetical protein VDV69_006181 [Pseudomonas aeruginosa]|nr:hypothetical protein [Pseudomonas aeruginosa]
MNIAALANRKPPSAEDPMELWLASDEYANWKLDAVESLLGDCDVDLHSKGFWSSKLKADLLREEIHKMLIDLLQNDRERLLATVIMAVADRRPCDALANLHNFFPEGDAAEAIKALAEPIAAGYAAEALAQYQEQNMEDAA